MTREERIEAVKDGLSRNLSAAQIASEIRGCTRNSVIGLAYRWQIRLNGSQTVIKPKKVSEPRPPRVRAPRRRPARAPRQKEIVTPVPLDFPDDHYAVNLVNVQSGQCRFPLWGSEKRYPVESYMFCGKPVEPSCSFCSQHREKTSVGKLNLREVEKSIKRLTRVRY